MGSTNSIDVKIAIFLKKCFNYYIKKRTGTLSYLLPSIKDEIWQSLFINNDTFLFDLDCDLIMSLYKDSIYCKLIYFGFEQDEIGFLRKYLKKGDTFFDIGANIGLYTLYASKILDENGRVFAFEPTPSTFERLQYNIQINNLANIKSYNLGLSNKKSTLELHISRDGYDAWNSFALLDKHNEVDIIKVDVVTIDGFLKENEINKIALIKVDVEGWEKYVLQGATELLKKENSPVFLIEFTEENAFASGYYLGELYDFLKQYGYDWYSYNQKNNLLTQEKKKLHYPYENLIAIKNMDYCQKRISE